MTLITFDKKEFIQFNFINFLLLFNRHILKLIFIYKTIHLIYYF